MSDNSRGLAGFLKRFHDTPCFLGCHTVQEAAGCLGIEKINDVYRKVIYVKTADYHDLVVLKDRTEKYIEINSGFDKMRIQFDFNPM